MSGLGVRFMGFSTGAFKDRVLLWGEVFNPHMYNTHMYNTHMYNIYIYIYIIYLSLFIFVDASVCSFISFYSYRSL